MEIGIAITIALAAITALGALAFKDLATYKRLFDLLKSPISALANVSAGAFIAGAAIRYDIAGTWSVMATAACVGLASLAASLVLVFFIWLRDDFARYAPPRDNHPRSD